MAPIRTREIKQKYPPPPRNQRNDKSCQLCQKVYEEHGLLITSEEDTWRLAKALGIKVSLNDCMLVWKET